MRFWDASAIVPLLVAEPVSPAMRSLAGRDPDMLAWWGSRVECASALARLARTSALASDGHGEALDRLRRIADAWREVEPAEVVRENALRFLRVHPLRAADALQLAAAFIAAEHRPSTLPFVSLDDRLAEAARKEGFEVVVAGG